jgi:hypothetical protein
MAPMVKPATALAKAKAKAAASRTTGQPPSWVTKNKLKWEYKYGRIIVLRETTYRKKAITIQVMLGTPGNYLTTTASLQGFGEPLGKLTRYHLFLGDGVCHLVYVPRIINSYEDYQRLMAELDSLLQKEEGWKR